MKTIYIYIIFSLVLLSCNNLSNIDKSKIISVNLVEGFENKRQQLLSDIATNIQTVYLNSNEECLIAKVSRVIIDNKKEIIIILDKELNQILFFDNSGNYLYKINKIGEGPNEYSRISNIIYYPASGYIYVYDDLTYKILKYSYKGKYIDYFKIPTTITATGVSKLGDKYLLLTMGQPFFQADKGYSFVVFDTIGNIISRFYYHDKDCCKISDPSTQCFWDYFNNSVSFKETSNRFLFKVKPDLTYSKYYEIICNRNPPDNEILNNFDKYLNWLLEKDSNHSGIDELYETSNYMFFWGVKSKYLWNVFYIKSDKNSYYPIFDLNLGQFGFINDLNGGMPFWPNGRVSDNVLINVYNPQELKNIITSEYIDTIHIKFPEKYKELLNHLDTCSLETNQFIDIVTLKH